MIIAWNYACYSHSCVNLGGFSVHPWDWLKSSRSYGGGGWAGVYISHSWWSGTDNQHLYLSSAPSKLLFQYFGFAFRLWSFAQWVHGVVLWSR